MNIHLIFKISETTQWDVGGKYMGYLSGKKQDLLRLTSSTLLHFEQEFVFLSLVRGKQALQFLIGRLSEATAPLLVHLQAPGFVTVRIKHSLTYWQTPL